MRRQRARRWMVPAAAQRVRDRAAKSIGTVILLHRDDSVVGKGFACHAHKPNPAAAQSALHRRQYVEQGEKSRSAINLRIQIEFGEGTRYDLPQLILSIWPAEKICGDSDKHLPADPPRTHKQLSTRLLERAFLDIGLKVSQVGIVGIGAVGPVRRR